LIEETRKNLGKKILRKRVVMEESLGFEIKESDKLKGLSNYYIWSLKLRLVLKEEDY
jgi:hypothetical protein